MTLSTIWTDSFPFSHGVLQAERRVVVAQHPGLLQVVAGAPYGAQTAGFCQEAAVVARRSLRHSDGGGLPLMDDGHHSVDHPDVQPAFQPRVLQSVVVGAPYGAQTAGFCREAAVANTGAPYGAHTAVACFCWMAATSILTYSPHSGPRGPAGCSGRSLRRSHGGGLALPAGLPRAPCGPSGRTACPFQP